ncbi:hypothetical protein COU54_05845 [Candidatus Pacearchaeota archaeon CG10_big_fil_rev_8_21_14_0_10_31_24]|nr:MAG: hypothetical protein COU54_05845 [Candidatus Pacearchaeota archaeon CG10_big_fil_rev_8_21_14_0_10_31_24]
MNASSLKQLFTELILQGRKTIELRKWKTSFRGIFLIHDSRIPDKKSMVQFGFSELPCGQIVGRANFVRIKEYVNFYDFDIDEDKYLGRDRSLFSKMLKG